jgi:hypothetical protein
MLERTITVLLTGGGAAVRASEFIPRKKKLVVGPQCPACGTLMWLARIEPDEPDHDRRTFECPRCQDELTEVVKYR